MPKQFVKITEDRKSYTSFTNPVNVDGKIKFINSDAGKNALGYYELSVTYPATDDKHHAVLTSYAYFEDKVIGEFDIVENPKTYRTFSKLNLEVALFSVGLISKFDSFLQETTLSNEYGEQPLKRFYDNAQDLKEDNVYFDAYFNQAKSYLGLTDEQAEQILANSVLTSTY